MSRQGRRRINSDERIDRTIKVSKETQTELVKIKSIIQLEIGEEIPMNAVIQKLISYFPRIEYSLKITDNDDPESE